MNKKLEKTIEKLREKNLKFKIVDLNGPAVSVKDVMERADISVNEEEICKTLLLKGNGRIFGVFLKGTDKLDFKKLKKVVGKKARLLKKEEIKENFGFELGEVCPLFLDIEIIVDKRVLELKNVNMGSGDLLYGIEMSPGDILKCINYKIEDVV